MSKQGARRVARPRSRRTCSTRRSKYVFASLAASTSGAPSRPATKHSRSHRFRAIIAIAMLERPSEYAKATRSCPATSRAIRSSSRRTKAATLVPLGIISRDERRLARKQSRQRFGEVRLFDADLLLRVPLSDRDALPFEGVVVHGHGERRPNLVHSRIPAADRSGVVKERREAPLQLRVDALRVLRDAVLVHEGENGDGDRREPRRQPQDRSLPFVERQVEERPHIAIDAERELEDIGHELR